MIENAYLADLSSRHADPEQNWTRREADVALRLSENVAEHLVGRQIGIAEGKLYDAAGRLYAHGTTTCLVFDLDQMRQT